MSRVDDADGTIPTDYPFELDPFQLEAHAHIDEGRSVVVAAPTASGKTIVAEHAIATALLAGGKVFYTTPIKALSNQKFHDFGDRYGTDRVGLLTGDTVVNGDAPLVVMTTEVLRNMLYAGSPALKGLAFVIVDEVHYLQDPYRGPVWEEVIINTPPDVRFVYLSATVSNAEELTDWIESVRGPTALVFHEERPVELTNLYMVAERRSKVHVLPMLDGRHPNRMGHRFDPAPASRDRRRRKGPRSNYATPRRHEVLDELRDRDMLPAIVFIFSRAGTDEAMQQMVKARVDLTEPGEKRQIRAIAERHARGLSETELEVLGYREYLRAWESGVASHHAGLVPAFKEAVEACFVQGLIKLVFATETLAMGINMPARAVVIERLTKFNGETHRFLTPLEYTQLTGRAGRRGIDDQGYAIVLWSPWSTFGQVAELAASREFQLTSVFRPSYNMAVNMLDGLDQSGAHDLLDRSFAQFQTDSEVVRVDRRIARTKRQVGELESKVFCERGSVEEYIASLDGNDASGADTRDAGDIGAALARLKPGEVIAVPQDGPSSPGVVLSVSFRGKGNVKVVVLTRDERALDVTTHDFATVPEVLGIAKLPQPYQPNDPGFRHDAAKALSRVRFKKAPRSGHDAGPANQHPVAACPDADDHVRAAKELRKKTAQLDRLQKRKAASVRRIARQFDDIVGVLQLRGYVSNWDINPDAAMLRRIYHESDLAVAETLRLGHADGLEAPQLAALMSTFTYRHRGAEAPPSPRIRDPLLRDRYAAVDELVSDIQADEKITGLTLTPDLDPGFMRIAAQWAGGDGIDTILSHEDLTGGDFVRQIRQLIDLLRQVASVAPERSTRHAAAAASEALHRGVVASSSAFEPVTESDGEPPELDAASDAHQEG